AGRAAAGGGPGAGAWGDRRAAADRAGGRGDRHAGRAGARTGAAAAADGGAARRLAPALTGPLPAPAVRPVAEATALVVGVTGLVAMVACGVPARTMVGDTPADTGSGACWATWRGRRRSSFSPWS